MRIHSWFVVLSCVFCAWMLSIPASAHDTGTMASSPALAARATFGPQGQLWLVDVAEGHVRVRHSDDLGRHFSRPVMVNAMPEAINAVGENHPNIVFDGHGDLIIAWVHPTGHWKSVIHYARSTDGGKHFSPPRSVHGDPGDVTHGFASMQVDDKGRPVIVWLDSREHSAAMQADKRYRGLAVYYAWSDDGGAHFDHERKLMDHSCECCRIALSRTPNGSVAAFYRGIYGDNIRDHAFAHLHLGTAANRPERVTFSGWQLAACPEQGPGLAIANDGVRHGVWYEASHGPAIWYGQLRPGKPPLHKQKIAAAGAGHADIGVHGNTVWVVFNQVDAKGYQLMLRTSHDHGASFGPAHAIAQSGVAVYSPQLLVHAGHAYVAWNTVDGFRLVRVDKNGAAP